MSRALASVIGLGACALVAACGGDPSRPKTFSTDWNDDKGKSIAEVLVRLRSAKPVPNADLVVSVAGKDKIIATPLGAGTAWSVNHALDARPIITGGVVVVSGDGGVSAFDTATGKKLWTRPTGNLPLLGAGDDGESTAVTLSRGGGSTLLVVGRDGAVKTQVETDKALGDPAVVGGVVFVPWANQYVSALDAQTGEEIGRVVLRDKVSRAITVGGTLYFGELAMVRFDQMIVEASRGHASRVAIPPRELPGTPRLLVPGTEKVPPYANAHDRDRLFGRPDGKSDPFSVDSGRFYASYYRLVFGFEATKGQLAWVRTHPSDVIGGDAVAGGVLLCDEDGKLIVFDAQSGQTTLEKAIGEPIKSCVVQADTFQAPKAPSVRPSIGQQVTEAVTLREGNLATAQRMLLRELATLEDETATKTLIEIASDPRSAQMLATDARASLATRRNGAAFMLSALSKHYDYLHDVLASPPVGPLADALSAMKETKAASLLAAHLLDPAVTDDDVKRAAAALAVLATEKEMPQLKQFFSMYRGSAGNEELALAAASVAEAMIRVDAKNGRPIIEAAAKDPATVSTTRGRLEAILAAVAAPKK